MKANRLKLLTGEKKEISMNDVLEYLTEVKDKLEELDGRTVVSFNFPNDILKRIDKRMAKKKFSELADYIAILIMEDLENS